MSLFQPSSINWSYLSLGKVALIHTNIKSNKKVLTPSQIIGIIADNTGGRKFSKVGPSHPPKKKVAVIAHILNIFMYSARKNIAKRKPEYSVWKPPTNSCSASTKSKGALLTSATAAIKNIPKAKKK